MREIGEGEWGIDSPSGDAQPCPHSKPCQKCKNCLIGTGGKAACCPRGSNCLACSAAPSLEGAGSARSVQEVVDAVSGATWGTRNRIMENLFHADLKSGGTELPSFRPPGVSPE